MGETDCYEKSQHTYPYKKKKKRGCKNLLKKLSHDTPEGCLIPHIQTLHMLNTGFLHQPLHDLDKLSVVVINLMRGDTSMASRQTTRTDWGGRAWMLPQGRTNSLRGLWAISWRRTQRGTGNSMGRGTGSITAAAVRFQRSIRQVTVTSNLVECMLILFEIFGKSRTSRFQGLSPTTITGQDIISKSKP